MFPFITSSFTPLDLDGIVSRDLRAVFSESNAMWATSPVQAVPIPGMLQYLHNESALEQIPAGVLVKAAENGHLDVVRWVIDCDWDEEENEEDGGDEDYFDTPYLTSLGGEASLAIHAAATNGHLDVAKYLHARVELTGRWITRNKS